jgi:hypothetical protein
MPLACSVVSNLNMPQTSSGSPQMNPWRVLLSLLVLLTITGVAVPQETPRTLLIEVILKTHDIQRKETLVYVRVFSDGSAEAHPSYEVDFRTLSLKHAQVPSADMAELREILSSRNTQGLESKYDRFWGNVDFGNEWDVTIGEGENKKAIILSNFQPSLARSRNQPYPVEIEKIGCIVWELRRNVFNEPLGHDYIRGCREWGYLK